MPAKRRSNDAAVPVVVELFPFQSCSSCQPADTLLAELARTRPDILAMGLHATYLDRLGWKDQYSLPGSTERQPHYAGQMGPDGIDTPQLVAGRRRQAVGFDWAGLLAAIIASAADGRILAAAVLPPG